MKHFWPLRTYVSPLRTARVRMPDTSEPASGSVRQNEASFGASVSMPRYFALVSSEPPSTIGAVARPLHISDVPIPLQPHPISSSMRQPVRKPRPGPPYSSGMWVFMRPTSQAFSRTSWGHVPSLSYSQATGRISFSAKLCASSRMSFCSSVSVKSTTGAPCSQRGRAAASPEVRRQLIDSSVNVGAKGTPKELRNHASRSRTGFAGWRGATLDRVCGVPESRSGLGLPCAEGPLRASGAFSAADQRAHDDVDPGRNGQYREQDQAHLLGVYGRPAR